MRCKTGATFGAVMVFGRRPQGRRGTEPERPAPGPARGDRGHAGVLGRLPGRPLLRQGLAHHRRDGRHLGQPLKLVDGVWFGVDDQWSRRRRSSRADVATPLRLPARRAEMRRIDFVPDGRRAALYGLELDNPGRRQDRHGQGRRPLRVDGRLPVGVDGASRTPGTTSPTPAAYDGGALRLPRQGHAARREPHNSRCWPAPTRAARPVRRAPGHWGPQPGTRCAATDEWRQLL